MEIKLAGIVQESIVDGPGIRYVVFVQGCPHHCPGCHNPKTHDFSNGYMEDTSNIIKDILRNPMIQGVTLSGGEPMMQPEPLKEIAVAMKERGKDVFVYSGFTFEEIVKSDKMFELLKCCDYLIDGKFDLEKKSLALQYRGSSNQRIVDVQQSFRDGKVVEKIF